MKVLSPKHVGFPWYMDPMDQQTKKAFIGRPPCFLRVELSNEINLGWLGYIGDYTTQLYRALE